MRKFLPTVLAALCLSSAALAHDEPLPAHARYVSMGCSFAAGPGLQPIRTGGVIRCGQSAANYASLLAAQLDLALEDRSCGGATTAHILGPWNELPPQLDAVTPETRLVTITIGGNDLNYVGNLFAASCKPGEGFAMGAQTVPCPAMKLPVEADFEKLEANLREIVRQVAVRAPRARLVFVQYVSLVPDRACPAAQISAENARDLKAIAARLTAITARVAHAGGALVLSADRLSRHHTPCDPQPWSVGLPRQFDRNQDAPWHPNHAGMIAIADGLAKLLSAH